MGALRGGTERGLIAEDHDDLREAAHEIDFGQLGLPGNRGTRRRGSGSCLIGWVFKDVVMPKLNGPEADLRMAARNGGLAVIFTNWLRNGDNLISIRAREKAAVFQEPYGSQLLDQKLRERLEKKN